MLININIRVTFTIPELGETFTIDSSFARNNDDIVPFIAIAGKSVAGVMPIIQLTIANLPPDILTKVSLLNLNSTVRIDAGYNDDFQFIGEGNIIRFPEIESKTTEWLWSADITPLPDFLNRIDYTETFENYRTWEYVLDRYFAASGLTIIIPPDLAQQTIGAEMGLNVNTFVDLQDFFKARQKILDYRDGIISFSDGISNAVPTVNITPEQIHPNQYLDFQSGRDAMLSLAAWVPSISTGLYVNLINEDSVNIFGTTQGFNGTMFVLRSSIYISTTEASVHEIDLRPLTDVNT